MKKIINGLAIFFSVFLSASLLKGAGIGFETWYAAPEGLSQFMVILLTMYGVARVVLYIINFILK